MDEQVTLPGLEHTVRERAVDELARGLRDCGMLQSDDSAASKEAAKQLLSYLEEAELLIADAPVETAVAVEIVRTCVAVPEQYEIFRDGRQIGYLRLRHGFFRADYPDHTTSNTVYSTGTRGDGSFYDDEERAREIRTAIVALLEADGVEHPAPIFEIPAYPEPDSLEDIEASNALMEYIGQAMEAKRAVARERFLEAIEELLELALDTGASAGEMVAMLDTNEFLPKRAPVSYQQD